MVVYRRCVCRIAETCRLCAWRAATHRSVTRNVRVRDAMTARQRHDAGNPDVEKAATWPATPLAWIPKGIVSPEALRPHLSMGLPLERIVIPEPVRAAGLRHRLVLGDSRITSLRNEKSARESQANCCTAAALARFCRHVPTKLGGGCNTVYN